MAPSVRQLLESAVAAHRAGCLGKAESGYREVLDIDGEQPDALHLLGLILHERGQVDAALEFIGRARSLCPRSADIAYNLGKVHLAARRWREAAEANRAAVKLAPAMAAAHCNLGVALLWLGRAREAEASARTAISHHAHQAPSWSALGLALQHQDRNAEARIAWERAIAIDPDFAEARFNLGALLLAEMNFAEGWPLFAARGRADAASFATGGTMPANLPRWQGEALAGRSLLLWGEQGLGDQILFAGLIPDLLQKGSRVSFACAPRLADLFARSFPDVAVLSQDDAEAVQHAAATADFCTPIASLGIHLRTRASDFPTHAGYLVPDRDLVAGRRRRYRQWSGDGPVVGISWRSTRVATGTFKSTALADWHPILSIRGVTFLALQYGDGAAEIAKARDQGYRVMTDPEIDPTANIDGLTAQIAATDLVISVSNTTVHLAGAINRPVWTLAPLGAGRMWYWFDRQEPWRRGLWYPSMRIYYQGAPGEWIPLLARIADELKSEAVASRR